ncbi:MAG: hypothetical protein ACHQ15_06100 [Candidatus Limnocylindrales bacterium]
MIRRALSIFAVGAVAATTATYLTVVRPLWKRWAIDPAEAARPLPGDDLVTSPKLVDTRGITIAASPGAVWPWLVQMGYGRAGWYSYDAIDMSHPSARQIMPEHQALALGDTMPVAPGSGFEVRVLEPDRALVLYLDDVHVRGQAAAAHEGEALPPTPANLRRSGGAIGTLTPGEFQASWALVLEPTDDGQTRLIERFRLASAMAGRPAEIMAGLLDFGAFVMTRRQMRTLKARVEAAEAMQLTPLELIPMQPVAPIAEPVPA